MLNRLQITALTLLCTITPTFGQEVLTLPECYSLAVENHSLSGEKALIKDQSSLVSRKIMTGWLPSADLNATAGYNSDVPDLGNIFSSIPFPIPEMNIPHDQYKVFVEISQVLYDGGTMKHLTTIEKIGGEIRELQNDIDIYQVIANVNDVYFSLLALRSQKGILETYMNSIGVRFSNAEAAAGNGLIAEYELDILSAEKLKIERLISDNRIMTESALAVMTLLTGESIGEETTLLLPNGTISEDEISRPELAMFDLKIYQIGQSDKLLTAQRLPKASAFAGLGYGNPPGNNFFSDSFDTYYYFGAGIKWRIFDWDKAKTEREINNIGKSILELRKEEISRKFEIALTSKRAQISQLDDALQSDSTNIILRRRIANAVSVRFDNGTMSASDLLLEMNALREAELKLEVDKISLARAVEEYNYIKGFNK